ncbi:putative inorganic phosphate cotransporter isoform X2 [Sipha flava]|nr:putative inorganic phosphate cotransporter isoform X2 [Sipha flava]XP_025422384.1 putative inorganic phosphate cotransporter isoform X2 [Sipha flava]XP_025422385.1 putative inorganic phosphate cotransporter isoform X2 [Sipha flava]
MVIAYAMRVNLSVGIVAMTDKSSANQEFIELHWNESTKSTVLSSFFWGYLITQVYAGQMAQKYGGKYFLVGSIGVSAFLTIITPISAIHGGVAAMCLNRMVQGMAQGFIFPVINVMLSKWAPKSEKSRLVSFVFSGTQFGSLVMLPVAGFLASSVGGWPSIFYVGGVIALVWVLAWCLMGANSPAEHHTISEAEKKYIITSLSNTTSKKFLPTPWSKIIKSMPMWTLLISHMAQNWGFWILLTNMPTYINYILKFNIKSNGFLSALPYLIMWILIILFSWISDYIKINSLMSDTNQRKMWNSIAHWGGALALFVLYLFDTSAMEAIILLTVALSLNSGIFTGFLTNHMDLAPNFAGTLMGITNSLANITSILGPLLVGFIVTDSSNKEQWGMVFLYSAAIFFVGNLIYVIFGTAEIQPWNDLSNRNEIQAEDASENS